MNYDDNGDPYTGGSSAVPLTESDLPEYRKMQAFTPAPAGSEDAWWKNLVSYGVSKAIDNTFPGEPYSIQGNTRPGSFAGQNGRSYNQRGALNAAPVLASGWLTAPNRRFGGFSPLMLVIGGFVVLQLVKK